MKPRMTMIPAVSKQLRLPGSVPKISKCALDKAFQVNAGCQPDADVNEVSYQMRTHGANLAEKRYFSDRAQ